MEGRAPTCAAVPGSAGGYAEARAASAFATRHSAASARRRSARHRPARPIAILQKSTSRIYLKETVIHFKKGVTLVEVLVAVALMAVMFTALYALAFNSRSFLRAAREESRSAQAAQYEIENLRRYSWADLTSLGATSAIPSSNNLALNELAGGSGFVTISPVPASDTNSDLRSVDVYISYHSFDGMVKTSVISTIIGKQGLFK